MKKHIEKVSVKVEAIEAGQHGGVIRQPGIKFLYQGNLINGEFPKWVRPLEKFKSEFSKLSPSEQEEFKQGKGQIFDAEAARKDIEREVRAEIEAEERQKLKEQIREEMLAEMRGSKGPAPADDADEKLTPKQKLIQEAQELGLNVTEEDTVPVIKEKIAAAKEALPIL